MFYIKMEGLLINAGLCMKGEMNGIRNFKKKECCKCYFNSRIG